MCIHSTAGCRGWLFKKETSCFYKSHWTLRGSTGLGGGLLYWYRSLMGTADNTHYPSPSIPSILQPPVLWATGRNRRCRNTGRETWALQLLHLMILKQYHCFLLFIWLTLALMGITCFTVFCMTPQTFRLAEYG